MQYDQSLLTIQKYPLDKKIVIKTTVRNVSILLLSYLIGRFFIKYFFGDIYDFHLVGLDIFFLVFPFLYLIYQYAHYKSYSYDVRNDFLIIKKGVFNPRESSLPYDKFQDVYIDQDVLDRIFKIYDIHVSTATSLSAEHAHIDGLNKQSAETVRELILEQIRKHHK